jgi:hypothetical protein
MSSLSLLRSLRVRVMATLPFATLVATLGWCELRDLLLCEQLSYVSQ